MGEFTASNGVTVNGYTSFDRDYLYCVSAKGDTCATAAVDGAQALREFFEHERDEQLGRWRWPERPDYVVTPFDGDPDHVLVVQESAGVACEFVRASAYGPSMSGYHSRLAPAARAYFDAHPERKPWHDAKEGEAWVITVPQGTFPAIFQAGAFRDHGGYWEAHDITDARRIWPEGGES